MALADRIKCLRDHGQAKKYHHSHIGWNGRMDGIQAAALSIKLRRLWPTAMLARRSHARLYADSLLEGVPGVSLPYVSLHGVPVYHLYVIRVEGATDCSPPWPSEGSPAAFITRARFTCRRRQCRLGPWARVVPGDRTGGGRTAFRCRCFPS